ncbi:MAG: PLP-dependent aminotransferase family protein [Bryobacteraceae bacterium]
MQWTVQLDTASDIPLYRQLYEYFAGLLRSGKLTSGDRLPATRELAGMLGLNRATVNAAYELLQAEGLISQHVGRGTFITNGFGSAGPDWSALLMRPETLLWPPAPAPAAMSFASSRPDERLFPLEQFHAACREVLAGAGLREILQLGPTTGYEPLRRRLEETAPAGRDGAVMITNGCQQSLDLIARALVRPGDVVAIEDPVYPGLKNLFAQAGARLAGVPVGATGMDVESLGRALERGGVRLVVVTSNFQNPTGATLPLPARRELLRLAAAAGAVVVENDIYGELRYTGDPIPPLKQLDPGNVVLVRSFSKIAFPGLRVGWLCGPRPLVGRLAELKQLADLHTDQFAQAVLLRLIECGALAAHLGRVVAAGAQRLAAALDACQKHLPRAARFTRPQGGMNLWVELPGPLDAGELLPRAEREGVAYLPGKYFAVSHPAAGALRLSFAALEPELIRKGIETLGAIFSREFERVETARGSQPAPAMV